MDVFILLGHGVVRDSSAMLSRQFGLKECIA